MTAIYKTKHGHVTIGDEYWHYPTNEFPTAKAVDLKLIKTENLENGWGVTKRIPATTPITQKLLNEFADEASEKM
ncbi:hypothetical protein [Vibrio sp. SCSIO 43136]|uniref:hypothetical protein n=1 Tax=Vibrio sp. SCSIO 43136 TaxID=2819101 RepID=UPI002074BE76|nr:hypothetical protein [Vibrio sp. SCSIO 43136]USD68099.1 hypothetical protein J4N39_18160 [Vibrio sp. SCSIO 43136]